MITTPWGFENIEAMNRWIAQFERDAREICSRNGVPDYYSTIRWHKDTVNLKAAIQSIGQFVKGSAQERASIEIITLFNQS